MSEFTTIEAKKEYLSLVVVRVSLQLVFLSFLLFSEPTGCCCFGFFVLFFFCLWPIELVLSSSDIS